MQVNCEDVARSRWQPDHSGSLQVQVCKESKSSRRDAGGGGGSGGSSSFCRLRGNLLFVGRGIDPTQLDCEHVILLEECKVEVDYSARDANGYPFRLVFSHENQLVVFRAASEEERSAWVAAVQSASVFEKLAAAEALRQDVGRLTGRDPLQPGADAGGVDLAPDDAESDGLELHARCRQLPPLPGASDCVFPSSQLHVHVRAPPLDDWTFVGSSDVVENSADPTFRKLVLVPDGQFSDLSDFRFDLYDVRDPSSRTMHLLFSVQVSAAQLQGCVDLPLQGDAADPGDQLPRLLIDVRKRAGSEQHRYKGRHMQLLRHLCNGESQRVASHSYKFEAEAGDHISVREFLCDVRCAAHVPLQVAQLELQRLLAAVEAGSGLGQHNCPPDGPQQLYSLPHEARQLQLLLKTLCDEVQECEAETSRKLLGGEFLKLSRLRGVQQLAFLPPNLQLHRLAVLDSKEKLIDFHDIVSMGAPAAHHAKFKKGGLLSAYRDCPQLQEAVGAFEEACDLLLKGRRLCDDISKLLPKLQVSVALRRNQSQLPTVDREQLAHLVNELICVASNYLVVQARVELELSVPLQAVHKCLQRVLGAEVGDAGLAAMCEQLQQEVRSVWQRCQLTLGRLCLVEGAKAGAESFASTLRRRMSARSQLLAACACGVLAHFSRWSEAAWQQMDSCGLPVYFESLVSTYKDEGGMLEDAVGAMPLLEELRVQFHRGDSGDAVKVEDLRHVRLRVPARVWDRLSPSLDAMLSSRWFRVRPLLFNVGINEQQTLAERKRLSLLATQRELNRRSAKALEDIVDSVLRHRADVAGVSDARQFQGDADFGGTVEEALRDKLQLLQLAVEEDKSKPVAILQTAEEIFWLLDGVRITNCKSGKDRTAMAVTLEQARWLRDKHGLRADRRSFDSTLAFLREHGLRRKNCFRNIGTTYYAFNRVQLQTFPQQYRPPKGTYQRGPT